MSGLEITTSKNQDGLNLKFKGIIDEHVSFKAAPVTDDKVIIFDLSEIILVNSAGIRAWVIWMKERRSLGETFIFRNCARVIVDQINILAGFLPPGSVVESFFVPYYCESCDASHMFLFKKGIEYEKGTADAPMRLTPLTHLKCPKCGLPLEMDVMEAKYFSFLKYR